LAALLQEPGHERVGPILRRSYISSVNLAEVLSRLLRDGADLDRVSLDLELVGLTVVPFDRHQARRAAELAPSTQAAGLSLGECACLALAMELELPAMTADRVWATLGLDVEVRLIR
jgi:PIN domain nuclease of toxin-antitoxin system